MKIIENQPNKENFDLFLKMLALIYPKQSVRLLQNENIDIEHLVACYVLIDNNIPLARVCLYRNFGLIFKGVNAYTIGNYECIDDTKIATKILTYAISKAKLLDAEYLIGPMNGSTWNSYRFKTDNINSSFFLEDEHHLYYNNHFKSVGFETIANYKSILIDNLHKMSDKFRKRESFMQKEGISIRNINLDDFDNEIERIYHYSLLVFKDNFLFTPISKNEFNRKYLGIKSFIDKDLVFIAENKKKEIVGFVFAVEDKYMASGNRIIGKTVAAKQNICYAGLGAIMAYKLNEVAIKKGYKAVIHAYIVDNSRSLNFSSKLGCVYRNYALYGLKI